MSQQSLLRIYKLFFLWAEDFDFACRKGCSACCTQSVTMTMLEGELIFDYIRSQKPDLLHILDDLPESTFNPITTNHFAAACLHENIDEVEEQDSWNRTPCVFLKDDCCVIYPVRSFMCRSLGSRVLCKEKGEAEMDPLFLTMNTLILQCVEHLDQGRPWGNMNTILSLIRVSGTEKANELMNNLRVSKPIPGFLIPPAETEKIQILLQKLLKIIQLP